MDKSTIREYLANKFSGQHVRLVGPNVVTSYWQWSEMIQRHVLLANFELVNFHQVQQAYEALDVVAGEQPSWVEAIDLAIKTYANWRDFIPVQIADIQAQNPLI